MQMRPRFTHTPLLLAALSAAWCMQANGAAAYSSFPDYLRRIEEGGGGGRLFTGTPADAHGCDVCHRDVAGAPLEVLGLPVDGYVPGQSYEIQFRWPATAPHVALMAEFTNLAGAPAGLTALAPYATWQAPERCENGFPAADVCRAGASGGCCRELDMARDACSFPGERSVLWVLDCGSKSARAIWTAPAASAGDVWFSSSMVTSNIMNDARGDGASSVRKRLRVAGSPPEVSAAVGTCQIGAGAGAQAWWWIAGVLAMIAARMCRSAARRAADSRHEARH